MNIRCGAALIAALAMASPAAAADLALSINGAGAVGQLRVMVFRDSNSFARREQAFAALVLTPQNGLAGATLSGLPPGTYAVAAYQDVNGNQQLDSNLFGIPQEPVGFSNAPTGSPLFGQAAVTMGESGISVDLTVR